MSARQKQRIIDSIEVFVSWSGRESVEGRIYDLSARGPSLSVALAGDGVPDLPLGSFVAVTIKVPRLDPLNNLISIVRDQSFVDGVCRLALEIVDWNPVRDAMPRELFSLFSRRRYVRVDTLQEAPILVSVTWHDEKPPMKAHLANISGSGCALLFALGCTPRVDELLLAFRLPGSTYGYHLKGKIRIVIDTDQRTSCGIEFDDDHSHDFLAQQSRITRFVENRQQKQVLELTNRFRALTIER